MRRPIASLPGVEQHAGAVAQLDGDLIERLFAHAVGPPELRVVDDQRGHNFASIDGHVLAGHDLVAQLHDDLGVRAFRR